MDMTRTIEPDSGQLNADDLMAGPVTVTITGVTRGTPEQPVNVELAEYPGRPYRPAKSMRRVLVAAWGKDSSVYAGRRLTLYRDPRVRFGREEVGGIRISHLSHIGEAMTVMLTVTRGRRAPFTVQPLPDDAPRETVARPSRGSREDHDGSATVVERIDAATTLDDLRALWDEATTDAERQAIRRRAATIGGETR